MEKQLDSDLLLHVTCHYVRRPPISFLVKYYNVRPPLQKFRSKFLRALRFLGFCSFFFVKNRFEAEITEKIATKATMLFFSNIYPKIASVTFLTIRDPLKST